MQIKGLRPVSLQRWQFSRADKSIITQLAPWVCWALHAVPHMAITIKVTLMRPEYSDRFRWWNWCGRSHRVHAQR